MENARYTKGSAVSIDIINSTGLYELMGSMDIFQLIERMHKAIEYAIEPTYGKVVHYSGDGALLFFEDGYGATSAEQAIRFGVDFSNIWRKMKCCFGRLRPVDFRISIDYGNVIMRDDGGLWSGYVLNNVCKIRYDRDSKNRVIVTENVMNALPDRSFYRIVFRKIEMNDRADSGRQLYIMNSITKPNDYNPYRASLRLRSNLKWVVCISGINKKKEHLEIVLNSIEQQSYIPELVLIVGNRTDIEDIRNNNSFGFSIIIIDQYKLENTNRAAVRNILQNRVLKEFNYLDVVCFLDGDTVISPFIFECANSIFKTNINCMISAPRIEFDCALSDEQARDYSSVFLGDIGLEYNQYRGHLSPFYFRTRNNTSLDKSNPYLASYLLIVPMKLVGEMGAWDENFTGWGEEDIDYTYRAYKKGNAMIVPLLPNNKFITMHLSHKYRVDDSCSLLTNTEYLLSKYPELRKIRKSFYEALGM